MVRSQMPGLSLLSCKGSKLQLEMAWEGCAISTAAVLMDKVEQLPTERACLLLAQAVGLDNLSKPPSGYIFYGLHFHAVSFSLFCSYVMAVNPGALSPKTDSTQSVFICQENITTFSPLKQCLQTVHVLM